MMKTNVTDRDLVGEPSVRKLRIFAFDPGVSGTFDQADVGEVIVEVRWESGLRRGPVGEYIEVIDVDHASGAYYKPVDLDNERVLAQNGLPPSEGNPQFHQQMVYAVAMSTINHFEKALGRVALWSSHYEGKRTIDKQRFVRRLRIYPHAFRGQNAYYSPPKKALQFGYFPVEVAGNGNVPGTMVFTCLSHDIIAHETTHALLDGVHPRFNIPFNQDVLAFHEAFADIVAMLQKFAYPGVLRQLIARSRGNLASDNLLGQLAQQFGRATGRGHALRDAIGYKDAAGRWQLHDPDPAKLARATAPHARGAILVAAVFGAFLKVYRARTADLYRIASNGTGVLADGAIHPDLTNRLAEEARVSASTVLRMCIRAIDYCPPVGITFGDYLRGIVTADVDLYPDDADGYRLALIESFRQWGIYPEGLPSVSAEALTWPDWAQTVAAGKESGMPFGRAEMSALPKALFEDKPRALSALAWSLDSDRLEAWKSARENAVILWKWLAAPGGKGRKIAPLLGIVLSTDAAPTINRSDRTGEPSVEIHSVRPALRRSARGASIRHLVVEIMQRRRGYFDKNRQADMDLYDPRRIPEKEHFDFMFWAGCTLLFDPEKHEILRVIRTPGINGAPRNLVEGTIADNDQLDRVRNFLLSGRLGRPNAFDGPGQVMKNREFFAALHMAEAEEHDV
jgi:hypothetical protein